MGIQKNFEGDGLDNEQINAVPPLDLLTDVNQINDSSTSSDDEEEEDEVQVNLSNQPAAPAAPIVSTPIVRPVKVKKLVSKMPKPILHVKSLGGKKSQGNRQARRHENMCFLLNLARDLDEDFAAAVNIHDLVETTVSAFAQLLLSKSKMKIWNEFIELPENQQERLIKLAKTKKKSKSRRKSPSFHSEPSSDDSFVLIDKSSIVPTTTNNEKDSTFSEDQQEEANECFRRIDSNIRQTLKSLFKRDHLPLDRIRFFEDDLIPFFSEHPTSIYLRNLNHGFDRMILHAVCQYLNLISKSSTRDGERYTEVENRQDYFLPPMILLSNYLKHL